MTRDPFIAEAMWERIDRELATIEREQGVRILLAVESGSRAWRFPSPDSDYDVRFIYAHPCEAYLSIEPPSDVIERPSDGVLDISGWDIRKALQLLVRSNAVLLEWLTSPVRYRHVGTDCTRILTLARETCCLPALTYHYDRLARRSFADIASTSDLVPLKTYCYALRSALALLWTRRRGEPPPMDLPSLLGGLTIADDVRQAAAELVERKAAADERGTGAQLPALNAFIAETLVEPAERFTLPDRAPVVAQANALFDSVIRPAAPPREKIGPT